MLARGQGAPARWATQPTPQDASSRALPHNEWAGGTNCLLCSTEATFGRCSSHNPIANDRLDPSSVAWQQQWPPHEHKRQCNHTHKAKIPSNHRTHKSIPNYYYYYYYYYCESLLFYTIILFFWHNPFTSTSTIRHNNQTTSKHICLLLRKTHPINDSGDDFL